MTSKIFATRTLRIEMQRQMGVPYFICWRPHSSVLRNTKQEVLKWASWPIKTETGDALREWLDTIIPTTPVTTAPAEVPLPEELLATGFGPECHDDDPTANTRTII